MDTFILIGPKEHGKTTIRNSYIKRKGPEPDTYIDETKKGRFWWRRKLVEYGGNATAIKSAIDELKGQGYLLYVFSGEELLKEISNPSQGGSIYSLWLHYKTNLAIENCHFVATFADRVTNMSGKILNEIHVANEKYRALLNSENARRYDNTLFCAPFFHCLNATDFRQVQNMIDHIRKSKLTTRYRNN